MEGKVAKTLLDEKQKIVIGGETFIMKAPSIATLVLASKYIGKLPSKKLDEKHLIPEMLKIAHTLEPLGYAISAMILGAREFKKIDNPILSVVNRNRITKGQVLAEKINHSNVSDVLKQFFVILDLMKLSDFFQLTTFLIELNMTKPTRKVVK